MDQETVTKYEENTNTEKEHGQIKAAVQQQLGTVGFAESLARGDIWCEVPLS